MIQVDNLLKTYGKTVAVDRVSFRVAEGEVVGFLGPNGAGKTTTLRILTCFMPATDGTATVANFDVHDQSMAVRRIVGYLPENVPLYGEMRVREYLDYRARLKGVRSRAGRRKRIGESMERCGVTEVSHRLCGQLSKGFRQRVGLADCLVHDPQVLILDEPTVGLDPNQIRETRKLIAELGRERTVLLSTHILPEVEMICGSVIVIHEGRIVARGSAAELKRRHARQTGIRLEVEGPEEQVVAAVKGVAKVKDVRCRREDAHLVLNVTTEGGADIRRELGQAIARKGWALLGLSLTEATLEDVFARITHRED